MINIRPVGVVGIGAFLILNTPSLKLIAGVTPLVNAFATVILFGAGFNRLLGYWTVQPNEKAWTLFFGVWTFILLVILPEHLFVRRFNAGHVTSTLRMIYTLACTGVIAACATKRDVRSLIQCQMIWGAALAVAYLGGLVTYSFAQGVHYKTLSLPVALSTLTIIGAFLEGSPSWRAKIGMTGLALLNVTALTALFSRSPFVFITATVAGFAILKRQGLYEVFKGTVKVLLYSCAGAIAVYLLLSTQNINLDIPAINRLYTLADQGDARGSIWAASLQFIQEYPFGMGWGAFQEMTGEFYPHNIILEAGVVAGVFGAALILLMIAAFTIWVFRTYRKTAPSDRARFVQMSYVAFYLIATFLVSYSLSYSYLMFTPIAMTTAFFQPHPSKACLLSREA